MLNAALDHFLERKLFTSAGRKVLYYTLTHGFYGLLAGGFEIALLLRLSGSFERIVIANLCMYCLLFLFFIVGTLLLRSGKASRGFRLDLCFQMAASAYMVLNFNSLANPYVLAVFFVLKGASEGLYWSTLHSAYMHSVADAQRDRYALTAQTITICLSVVLPIVSGVIISYASQHGDIFPVAAGQVLPSGYLPVYLICMLVSGTALLLSPNIRIPRQNVCFAHVRRMFHVPGKAVWLAYHAGNNSVGFLTVIAVGIINFKVLKNELNIGFYAAGIALTSALFFFFVRRRLKHSKVSRVRMIALGDAGDFLSRLLYVNFPNLAGLLGKSVLDTFVVPFRNMFAENIARHRIELMCRHADISIAEGVLFQEVIIFLVRALACTVLIVLLNVIKVDAIHMAKAVLLYLMAYCLVDYILLKLVNDGNHVLLNK